MNMASYPMETKTLVETLETPIKTTGSSSKGYEQRWAVLALKPHLIHSNLNFSKSPPNQSSAQPTLIVSSSRRQRPGRRTPHRRPLVDSPEGRRRQNRCRPRLRPPLSRRRPNLTPMRPIFSI